MLLERTRLKNGMCISTCRVQKKFLTEVYKHDFSLYPDEVHETATETAARNKHADVVSRMKIKTEGEPHEEI